MASKWEGGQKVKEVEFLLLENNLAVRDQFSGEIIAQPKDKGTCAYVT